MSKSFASSVMNGTVLLESTELYDGLMGDIEPDLLSHNLERTRGWIIGATPEEREEMIARYEAAFKEYDARMADFQKDWLKQFSNNKRTAMKSLERDLEQGEQQKMTSIESQISDASK